jgi:hypothetical protein
MASVKKLTMTLDSGEEIELNAKQLATLIMSNFSADSLEKIFDKNVKTATPVEKHVSEKTANVTTVPASKTPVSDSAVATAPEVKKVQRKTAKPKAKAGAKVVEDENTDTSAPASTGVTVISLEEAKKLMEGKTTRIYLDLSTGTRTNRTKANEKSRVFKEIHDVRVSVVNGQEHLFAVAEKQWK